MKEGEIGARHAGGRPWGLHRDTSCPLPAVPRLCPAGLAPFPLFSGAGPNLQAWGGKQWVARRKGVRRQCPLHRTSCACTAQTLPPRRACSRPWPAPGPARPAAIPPPPGATHDHCCASRTSGPHVAGKNDRTVKRRCGRAAASAREGCEHGMPGVWGAWGCGGTGLGRPCAARGHPHTCHLAESHWGNNALPRHGCSARRRGGRARRGGGGGRAGLLPRHARAGRAMAAAALACRTLRAQLGGTMISVLLLLLLSFSSFYLSFFLSIYLSFFSFLLCTCVVSSLHCFGYCCSRDTLCVGAKSC